MCLDWEWGIFASKDGIRSQGHGEGALIDIESINVACYGGMRICLYFSFTLEGDELSVVR